MHTNKTLMRLRKTGAFKWSGTTFEMVDERKLVAIVGDVSPMQKARPFLTGNDVAGWRARHCPLAGAIRVR